jgi:hypothetical protein
MKCITDRSSSINYKKSINYDSAPCVKEARYLSFN